ncbi:MAG: phosphonate ABC transporter, permease protein PhnE [Gammaproteobacteria bacterium]|nr:phosphonate ABC transporter, permease protein PhnE [Gammaproteobacteria bacterium]
MAANTLPNHLVYLEHQLKTLERTRLVYTFLGIFAVVLVLVSGIKVAEAHNAGSFWRGISRFFDYPVDMIGEAWNAGWNWPPLLLKYLPELLSTINMALLSTLVGAIFAVVVSIFASANLVKSTLVVQVTRRFMDLCRSFPELVIAMIFLYLMGKSELPAVIAIIIHTTGALGKLFSEAIENIDDKPLHGLHSVGAGWVQRVRFGVIPQVLPLFLSYALLRLEINVRASTILGFVGAGGIGEALSTVIQWRYGDEIIAIMALLVLTITLLDGLSGWVRNRLIGLERDTV